MKKPPKNSKAQAVGNNTAGAQPAAHEPMAPTASSVPVCAICGKPATCFGRYDAFNPGYACDDCCGHGNEDGWCESVAKTIARQQRAASSRRDLFEKWITSPPFERSAAKWPDDETLAAWPGHYKDYPVQLAWEAWQEALNSQAKP